MDNNKLNKIMPFVVLFAVLAYFILKYSEIAGNIIVALLGFGMLVFVHELGHFLAARKNDVDCEAFAIGMAIGTPFIVGVKKIENAWRIRVLPKTSGAKADLAEEDCLHIFTIPAKGKAGDTEYCLGPLPIGGFVKMIGQDDSGPTDTTNDTNPRSFANKSVGARMMITSAGVLSNLFVAFLIFLGLAAYGLERVPAIVGDVISGYPAAEAGLQPGDEIVEINGKSRWVGGKSNLDFTHLALAPMLGKRGEPIAMKVLSPDGAVREVELVPALLPGGNYGFGIEKPSVLKLANIDADEYYEKLGLLAGDEVFAVNGEPVSSYKEFEEVAAKYYGEKITVSAKRETADKDTLEAVTANIPLSFSPGKMAGQEVDLANVCSMVPLLKIVAGNGVIDLSALETEPIDKFLAGDVVLKIGDVEYPNFKDFRDVTAAHKDKVMTIKVLRKAKDVAEQIVDVDVIPKEGAGGRTIVGVELNLDMSSPVVASMASEAADKQIGIPAGATITAINGRKVSDFFGIANEIKAIAAGKAAVDYTIDGQSSQVSIDVPADDAVSLVSALANPIPFDDYRRMYKAENPIQTLQMGSYMILDMVDQAISSLKALVLKRVSANEMSGPVGIARISYIIVEKQSFAFFLYFLGMISCFLAVFNFLPIPVVDGGLFVLLIVEKIKGSPVSITVQKYLAYTGMGLLAALFIFVTFNDIFKIVKGIL